MVVTLHTNCKRNCIMSRSNCENLVCLVNLSLLQIFTSLVDMAHWIKRGTQDSWSITLKDFKLPTFWTVGREDLKVGVACCTENRLHTELVMEAVIVISNMSIQNTTCFREYGDKTEVLELVPQIICFGWFVA